MMGAGPYHRRRRRTSFWRCRGRSRNRPWSQPCSTPSYPSCPGPGAPRGLARQLRPSVPAAARYEWPAAGLRGAEAGRAVAGRSSACETAAGRHPSSGAAARAAAASALHPHTTRAQQPRVVRDRTAGSVRQQLAATLFSAPGAHPPHPTHTPHTFAHARHSSI